MVSVTTQLQQLLSAADEQKIDAAKSKELLLHLATEVSGVQAQVIAIRDDLHVSFDLCGESLRKKLAQNSQKHAVVLERVSAIDAASISITQEQTAAKEDADKTLADLELLKQQMIQFGLGLNDINVKLAAKAQMLQEIIQGLHHVPIRVFLKPMTPTGIQKFNPLNLLRDRAKLGFVCVYTMKSVACGPGGDGYVVTNLTEILKKALPLLRLGLMINHLQIGLLSTGVPIPIAGMANSALDQADKLSFLKSAAGLLQDDVSMDAVGSSLDSMEAKRRTNSTEQFETLSVPW